MRVSSAVCLCTRASKRLLRKFEENDYEKVERLVDLHMVYLGKVNAASNDDVLGECGLLNAGLLFGGW